MNKFFCLTLFSIISIRPGLAQDPAFFILNGDNNAASLIDGADWSKLADFASPAVMDIETESTNNILLNDPFFQPFFSSVDPFTGRGLKEVVRSSGSAVCISADGVLLTCHHVVDSAEKIKVISSNGARYTAKVIASYPEVDLAILRIENVKNLPFLKLGSSKSIKNGTPVAALGNSFNLGLNFTNGIVSAKKRRLRLDQNAPSPALIQHNAAVNPGNSGGALVDKCGHLIGINNAIYSKGGGSNGVGFAIPIDLIVLFLNKLKQNSKPVDFGVKEMQTVQQTSLHEKTSDVSVVIGGVLVEEINIESAAYKAGLRVGDIIVSINDTDIDTVGDFSLMEVTAVLGQKIRFSVIRNNEKTELEFIPDLHAEVSSETFKADGISIFKNVTFSLLTSKKKARYKISSKLKGLLMEVPADKKKKRTPNVFGFFMMQGDADLIQSGDILAKVNGVVTNDFSALKKALHNAKERGTISLEIYRGHSVVQLSFPLRDDVGEQSGTVA